MKNNIFSNRLNNVASLRDAGFGEGYSFSTELESLTGFNVHQKTVHIEQGNIFGNPVRDFSSVETD
jgi:hypothetical protein